MLLWIVGDRKKVIVVSSGVIRSTFYENWPTGSEPWVLEVYGICGLSEELSASEEWLFSMELVVLAVSAVQWRFVVRGRL